MKNCIKCARHVAVAVATILLMFLGGGCQDNLNDYPLASKIELTKKLEILDGTLKFETFSDYDIFYQSPETFELPDFENAKVIYLDNQGKIQGNLRISNLADEFIEDLEDSHLLEILDQDFMVIIDNYLIKLDFELKIAAVTEDFSEKERLSQRKYDSKLIKLYRFEDDVLQLLEEGKESTITTQELNSRILSTFDPNAATYCTNCDKIKCSLNSNIEGITFNGGNNFTYRLESKHVYQKVAIYFRLFSESKHMRRPSGSFLTWNSESTTLYIWYDVKFKSKKSGSSEIFLVNSANTFSNQLKPEYYVSSRGLEKYWVKSQFFGEAGGNHGYSPIGEFWQFNLCDIKDGY